MDIKDEISKVAYEIFVKSGCTPGRDMDNWLEAEKIVMEKYAKLKTVTEEKPTKSKKTTPLAKKTEEKTKTTSPKKKAEPKKSSK